MLSAARDHVPSNTVSPSHRQTFPPVGCRSFAFVPYSPVSVGTSFKTGASFSVLKRSRCTFPTFSNISFATR